MASGGPDDSITRERVGSDDQSPAFITPAGGVDGAPEDMHGFMEIELSERTDNEFSVDRSASSGTVRPPEGRSRYRECCNGIRGRATSCLEGAQLQYCRVLSKYPRWIMFGFAVLTVALAAATAPFFEISSYNKFLHFSSNSAGMTGASRSALTGDSAQKLHDFLSITPWGGDSSALEWGNQSLCVNRPYNGTTRGAAAEGWRDQISTVAIRSVMDDVKVVPWCVFPLFALPAMLLFRVDGVRSRVGMAAVALISSAMAIVAAVWGCTMLDLGFSELTTVLMFAVLAIGLDDAFIIAHSESRELDRVFKEGAPGSVLPEEVLLRIVQESGVSITVTSATDVLAFLVGWWCNDLVLYKSMCMFGAVGLFLDWVYQLTFFMAYVALDVKRQLASRPECCCRGTVPAASEGRNTCMARVNNLIRLGLQKLVMARGAMVGHTLLSLGVLVGSAVLASRLYMDFNISWNLSPDSDAMHAANRIYAEFGSSWYPSVDCFLIVPGFAVQWPEAHGFPSQLTLDHLPDTFTLPLSPIDVGAATAALHELLGMPGVLWTMPVGGGYEAEAGGLPLGYTALDDQKAMMVQYDRRDVAFVAHLCLDQNPSYHQRALAADRIDAFQQKHADINLGLVWVSYDAQFEVLQQVQSQVAYSLVMCAVTIALVLLLVYRELSLVLINMGLMGAALVVVPGFMYLNDLHINHPTMVNLVPLVGIGLDCTIHICMAYKHELQHRLSGGDPIEAALVNTLPGILLGQLTTLIPVAFLFGAVSYVMRAFWVVWVGMVVVNTYFATTLLPMLLQIAENMKRWRGQGWLVTHFWPRDSEFEAAETEVEDSSDHT